MDESPQPSFLGYKLAFLSGVFLTISHFTVKLETAEFHPLQITAINGAICGTVFLSYLLIRRSSLSVCTEERLYVAIHAFGHTGANLLFFYSLSFIPAFDATVIGSMAPIIGGVLAWGFLGEKLTVFDVILVIVVSIGLVLVCQPSFIFSPSSNAAAMVSSPNRWKGTLSAVMSALSWAITCCSNRRIQNTSVFLMEFYVYVVIFSLSVILLLSLGIRLSEEFKLHNLWIIQVSVAFLIGHALNCRSLQLAEVCRTGVIKNCENALMLLLQWAILGELPNVIGFIGSAVVLIGVIVFMLKEQIFGFVNKYRVRNDGAVNDSSPVMNYSLLDGN